MSIYESFAARLIGTPLQRPAQWLRHGLRAGYRRAHPELGELFLEDRRIEQFMRAVIEADTHCVDIGCHIGFYLQRFSALAPNGHHHAVEPVPHKAIWLRKKFPAVAVLEVALGDKNGVSEFYVDAAQTSLSRLNAGAPRGPMRLVQVQCRRLDELIAPGTRVGFIKVDVNGGELPALRGGQALLARDRPHILLGCTQRGLDDHGLAADEVFQWLTQSARYDIFLLKDFLAHGPALDAAAFRHSMVYPFKAFNYAVVPAGSG